MHEWSQDELILKTGFFLYQTHTERNEKSKDGLSLSTTFSEKTLLHKDKDETIRRRCHHINNKTDRKPNEKRERESETSVGGLLGKQYKTTDRPTPSRAVFRFLHCVDLPHRSIPSKTNS